LTGETLVGSGLTFAPQTVHSTPSPPFPATLDRGNIGTRFNPWLLACLLACLWARLLACPLAWLLAWLLARLLGCPFPPRHNSGPKLPAASPAPLRCQSHTEPPPLLHPRKADTDPRVGLQLGEPGPPFAGLAMTHRSDNPLELPLRCSKLVVRSWLLLMLLGPEGGQPN